MADVQWDMAIRGDLRKLGEAVARANTAGVRSGVNNHRKAVRRQAERAGLGPKVAKAWRGRVVGSRGQDLTLKGSDPDPTGTTYSKWIVKRDGRAIDLFETFETGTTITAKGGQYLEIRTSNAPGGRQGKSSQSYADGTFRVIPVGGKKRGRPAANRVAFVLVHRGTGTVWFLWIKTVRLKRRLRIAGAYRTAARLVERVVTRVYARELVKLGVAP